MNGLLMVSLGLMGLAIWAISISFTLGYSNFETSFVRYCQAILLLPIISGLVWLLVQISGRLYSAILSWLEIDPVNLGATVTIILLALLICLPVFVASIFTYHFALSKLDRYLDR